MISELFRWIRGRSLRQRVELAALLPIVALMGVLWFAPPDGVERAQLLQFFGRFHPLSVHLPIALLMLVPLLELAGRSRYFPSLRSSADFVLGVATGGAIAAAWLGWCLGWSEGASGPLVAQHSWGGVFVAAAAWICWVLCERRARSEGRWLYFGALAGTIALVSFTGHRGGQLSQGENYLTEYMPAPLASMIGVDGADDSAVTSGNGGPATFYGAKIQPIFSEHCTTCHGRNKRKGNLRLNNFDAMMRGGKHGAEIKAGDAKMSELFRRITLPAGDDAAMPPDNRRPVSASDLKLIELWIVAGASGTLAVDGIKNLPANSAPPAAEVVFEEIDPARVAEQRSALTSAVALIQKQFPNVVDYRSRSSAELVVNAAWLGAKFGDKELSAIAPVADKVVNADFSNTAVTDQSANVIAAMKHLRILRLMHTKVSDATVRALAPAPELETLNVFDTAITAASLPVLGKYSKLQHAYVGGTKVTADGPISEQMRSKLVF